MIVSRRREFIFGVTFGVLIIFGFFWFSENINLQNVPLNSEGEWPLSVPTDPAFADIEVNGHSLKFNSNNNKSAPNSKIRIHLVFHSHVDPGWLKTFEEYYQEEVKSIISNTVEALNKFPKLKFIWSETSFLERWWRNATEKQKSDIQRQVKSGQLEISGGAWVMTDEATPTFYGAIENLIEGHSVIHEIFGLTPNTSWSVDPFGHGAMMPELLKLGGIEAMVIGRFHNHIKKTLRQNQRLRWKWNSLYSQIANGPRVNSLPNFAYTTQDACDDIAICACYQIGPSSSSGPSCTDGRLLSNLTTETVEYLTTRFVDEMRKVQKYYGTEDILAPIGNDFYFGDPKDFEMMYKGFAGMAEFLEKNPKFNAEMRFSTVSDFFDAAKDEDLPDLRGDFFPYTSEMSNPSPWWTGYYVHRPHSKTMERRLQNSLRSLDIMLMLKGEFNEWEAVREAKRQLALFQHHDGITGTSKQHVMMDYEKRMLFAFKVFGQLFAGNDTLVKNPANSSLRLLQIPQDGEAYLTVFSSFPLPSTELIRLCTDVPVEVFKNENEVVEAHNLKEGEHNLVEFFADLNPLGFTVFKLKRGQTKEKSLCECMVLDQENNIKALKLGERSYDVQFMLQETSDNGGAYVMESGKWTNLTNNETDKVNRLVQRVKYRGYQYNGLEMTFTCLSDGELEISIQTDLKKDKTLALHIRSTVKNYNRFHTDVNAMYHLERRYQTHYGKRSLPLDANFYPVASSVFIQEESTRLSVLTGQPTGATSTEDGSVSILVDRWVTNDDGKGLSYMDCFDNRSSIVKFRILLEERSSNVSTSLSPYHSLRGHRSSASILYPPISVFSLAKLDYSPSPLPFNWPCGIQLVTWRSLDDSTTVLVLRRLVFEESIHNHCDYNNPEVLFDFLTSQYKGFYHSELSATVDGSPVTKESFLNSLKDPFSISTFRLHR